MTTVMIAEDDLIVADMLEEMLVQGGYEVCGIARTVEEGIELGDRCKPDLAILDIRLAEGGLGMDIAGRMHSKDRIGILYASANSSQAVLTKNDGAALLRKPYRAEDILRALKIVEQIVSTGEASQPFPIGFSVLSGDSPKSEIMKATEPELASADQEDIRLAAIVESSDDAIIAQDLIGVVFAWNRAAGRLLGYTVSEMIGQPLTVILPPDLLEDEAVVLGQIARGEKVDHYETTRCCKDGRIIRVSVTASPIQDASGRITGVSEILRDVTDRDARERRVQELQAERTHAQRLTELGQVVTTLVHEVNQPITAIRSYLNACQRLTATGNLTGAQAALARMDDQTKRASEIIQRIRDFVMKRDVRFQAEDLLVVINESVVLLRASLADEVPMLRVRVDPAEPHAEIDKVQVQQVLFNLMRNGIEAMHDQPTRELMVATQKSQSGMVEISVSDTGPGIPDDVRRRLFQPFVTTKPTGMGVGLSVCQGIVQLHGGRIWADEIAGSGTVFRFTVRRAGGMPPVIGLE